MVDGARLRESQRSRLGIILPHGFLRNPDGPAGAPGSHIAATEGCRGLLTFSQGRDVSLFVNEGDANAVAADLAGLSSLFTRQTLGATVIPISHLQPALHSGEYVAIHDLSGPYLDRASYARSQRSPQIIPATCTAYGFSYHTFAQELVSRLLLAPSYPCDSIICTNEVDRKAFHRRLDGLTCYLSEACGVPVEHKAQISMIPYGVNTDLFQPRPRIDVRRQLELPENKIVILYVGRLDPASKTDVVPLLLAFKEVLASRVGRIVLLLAGPLSRFTQEISTTIRDLGLAGHVIVRSNLPYVSIPLYYSAADLFVSLSDTLQENFGLTPIEAMSSGLPVVVSDWAGYQESVLHGQTGFKVPTRWVECDEDLCELAPFYEWEQDHFYLAQSIAPDLEATVQYLSVLVDNEARRAEMGERARQHVLENYTWERVVAMHWSLWEELSAVAARLAPTSRAAPGSLVRPHYFDDFRDFASEWLDASTELQLTGRGQLACAGKERLLLIHEPRQLLQGELLAAILQLLRSGRFIKHRVTLAELDEVLGKRHVPRPVARRHVMWLLKYGLIRIGRPTSAQYAAD